MNRIPYCILRSAYVTYRVKVGFSSLTCAADDGSLSPRDGRNGHETSLTGLGLELSVMVKVRVS